MNKAQNTNKTIEGIDKIENATLLCKRLAEFKPQLKSPFFSYLCEISLNCDSFTLKRTKPFYRRTNGFGRCHINHVITEAFESFYSHEKFCGRRKWK
jgi:hypothetical protein